MKYLIVIVLIIVSSCNNNLYPKFDYNKSENPWLDAFKDRCFFSALRESYKSDTLIFRLIEQKDALNPYDGLTLEEMKIADEIGKTLINKMPPPAMCENCPPGMNYYMATSLHFYKSNELDSIARKLYKEHIRSHRKIFGDQLKEKMKQSAFL